METNDALLCDKQELMNAIYDSSDGNQVDCPKHMHIRHYISKIKI